ncbi:MAG: ABC transporter permease subunit [Planctomycetota bacterium]
MAAETGVPARPFPIRSRGAVLISIGIAAALAYSHLGLALGDLVPDAGGLEIARDFFSRAFSPAMSHEADWVPDGTASLPMRALRAIGRTIAFAFAAMSLALLIGIVFGFTSSTAWWAGRPAGAETALGRFLRRGVGPAFWLASRTFIVVVRSIHELLWALLFLVSFGLSDLAAVLSIALPYGGYLAKIFSEVVDEAPRGAAQALTAAGASGPQTFLFGLVVRSLPDLLSYSLYRFECALRSSAVLGFFGYSTVGLFIRQSFLSSYYGEVWTYLYVLIAVILVFDVWSGAIRRRMV